jgi:histone deacetylase 1/2
LELNIESDVAGFLGILLKKKPNGTIELLQTGLIDRILRVTELENSSPKPTPAVPTPLGSDKEGATCQEMWSYASVVGMLMYLASNSRPDIAFAVHQCARFTHNPRASHEKAIKRIVRYLKGTRDRGLVIKPNKTLALDCHVDADFAGLFPSEDKLDPVCAKSRTGYVITLGNTPVLWVSKLQSKIALSTTESEYTALSTAMRDVLPLRRLIDELATQLDAKRECLTTMTIVWEDNDACRLLANAGDLPQITPRNKHFATEMHWFREHLRDSNGQIIVQRVDTTKQQGDIFTKGLVEAEYVKKRNTLMGWDINGSSLERECQTYISDQVASSETRLSEGQRSLLNQAESARFIRRRQ